MENEIDFRSGENGGGDQERSAGSSEGSDNNESSNSEEQSYSDEEEDSLNRRSEGYHLRLPPEFFRDSSEDSSDDEEESPDLVYLHLASMLRTHHCSDLNIHSAGLFEVVFKNIDAFCDLLASAEGVNAIFLGQSNDDREQESRFDKLVVTERTAPLWNKLCHAIKKLCERNTLEWFVIEGDVLCGTEMIQLLRILPRVQMLRVNIPWFVVGPVVSLVDELSKTKCENLLIEVNGDRFSTAAVVVDNAPLVPAAVLADEDVAAVVAPVVAPNQVIHVVEARPFEPLKGDLLDEDRYQGLLSRLFGVTNMQYLRLNSIGLSSDDCTTLVEVLTSSACKIELLDLDRCAFLNQGGKHIAEALSRNVSLERLFLCDSFTDEPFREALLSFLPQNTLIETLRIAVYSEDLDVTGHEFAIDLCKSICSHTQTLRNLEIVMCKDSVFSDVDLSGETLSELQQAMLHSYSLENFSLFDTEFEAITDLNKAGRRYLLDDAASKSRCIAVLAKVKNNLDSLFIHFRENPILCMSDNNCCTQEKGTKRKAEGDVTGARKAKKEMG